MIDPPEIFDAAPRPAYRAVHLFFEWPLTRLVPLLAVLLFLGALFWAKAQDPFARRWFTLKAADHSSFNCVAVQPKPLRRYPVVVYAHGAGGGLMEDGTNLRQMAELGLAVVSLDYDQTSQARFDAQWTALLQYLDRQKWVNTNAIAWVGFSLGANETLVFARQHPARQPKLLVQISGAGLPEAGTADRLTAWHCPLLLVHGGQDEIFPVTNTQRLADALQTNGQPVALHIISGAAHDLGRERGVVFRSVGEYCLTHLAGPNAWQHYHSLAEWQAEAPPFWLFCLPAMLLAGLFIGHRAGLFRNFGPPSPVSTGTPLVTVLSRGEIALRWLAVLLAAGAVIETALHLVTPRFSVRPTTLNLARRMLVQPRELADFDYLAALPVWAPVKLRSLLDHVELDNYNRQLVNWLLNDRLYREDVLSPIITGRPGELLDWRRPLWEEFYPRIRHEDVLTDAAGIIERHLRERVTIARLPGLPHEVPAIWRKQITDEAGFAVISVAALRSAGVPARLDARAQAEFWNGTAWQPVPLPSVISW